MTVPEKLSRSSSPPALFCAVALLVLLTSAVAAVAADWEATVTPLAAGSFPELRPLRTTYHFRWNGITAGEGQIRFGRSGDRLQFEATGASTGLARSLWSYDLRHLALADAQTLRPLEVKESEDFGSEHVTTHLTFTPEGVKSAREERKGAKVTSKTRSFDFPNVLSLNSALLLLRTQPLSEGSVQRLVVYPATSAYLVTVTVGGHDQITVPTGTYDAVKVDVQLQKIDKKRKLKPYKRFRHATVWLSNDADRLILRIEAQIFVGKVFAELQSVQFENAKP